MASAAIALALLVVAVVAVPLRLWASRLWRPPVRPTAMRRAAAPGHLRPAVRRLVRRGRELLAIIDALRPVTAEYRRTLPYLSLFFAERSHYVRRDRWIVDARDRFEDTVSEVAQRLRKWDDAWCRVQDDEPEVAVQLGAVAARAGALLRDTSRLPRTYAEARRFRFCEDWEVDRLLDDLETIGDDLRTLDAELCTGRRSPYRAG